MEPFEFTVSEVVASKMDLLSDGGPFFYLRKGEAQGAIEVSSYAISLIQNYLQLPDGADATTILTTVGIIGGSAAAALIGLNKAWESGRKQMQLFLENLDQTGEMFRRLKEKLSRRRPRERAPAAPELPVPRDIRVICDRNSQNERAIPMLVALGARLRYRPRTLKAGTHRFHLNERRFSLHYKSSGGSYIGVIGDDEFLREKLKADFLDEWERCKRDVGL